MPIDIGISVAQLVRANSEVQALIGERFYPVLVPESPTYPCATYQVISDIPNYTLDGSQGMDTVRLQIDTWSGGVEGASYLTAKQVQRAIRDLLESYAGQLPDGTFVGGIFVSNASDLYEQDARVYRTTTDYLINFYPA